MVEFKRAFRNACRPNHDSMRMRHNVYYVNFNPADTSVDVMVYAPAGTAPQLIDKLSSVIVAALGAPDLRAKFMALCLEPTGTTAGELAAIMEADTAHWAPIIKAAGFSVE